MDYRHFDLLPLGRSAFLLECYNILLHGAASDPNAGEYLIPGFISHR